MKFKNLFNKNRELLLHSFLALVIRALAAVASFIMNMVISRRIGAEESGYFFLALAVITFFSNITRLGTDNAILKYVSIYAKSKQWFKVNATLNIALKYTLIFSCIVALIIVVFSKFISNTIFSKPLLKDVLIFMTIGIPFTALYNVYSNGFQAIKKVFYSVSFLNLVVPILVIIAIVFFVPATAEKLSILYLGATVITVILAFIAWKTSVPPSPKEDTEFVDFWKSSRYLWIIMILQQLMQWGGQFIAGVFVDSKSIALLAVAQRTSMLISFILIAVNFVSAPRFATYYNEGDMAGLKKFALNTTRVMTLVATPLVVFVMIYPRLIMSAFGHEFIEGANILRILSLGQFINVITGSVGYLLMMTGHEKEMRNVTIINAILSILLSITFTYIWGALGAAISIAVSVAVQNFMIVYIVKRKLGFTTIGF